MKYFFKHILIRIILIQTVEFYIVEMTSTKKVHEEMSYSISWTSLLLIEFLRAIPFGLFSLEYPVTDNFLVLTKEL